MMESSEADSDDLREECGNVIVERRVEQRRKLDRGLSVQRLAFEDDPDVVEDSAFHPLELERMANAGEGH
jgi:hypothetical protein